MGALAPNAGGAGGDDAEGGADGEFAAAFAAIADPHGVASVGEGSGGGGLGDSGGGVVIEIHIGRPGPSLRDFYTLTR